MNKPAAKEPSMDEILSSIRQIIADDDEPAPASAEAEPADAEPDMAAMMADDAEEVVADEPLALSAEQILDAPEEAVAEDEDDEDIDLAAQLVVPDDIAFEANGEEQEVEAEPFVEPVASAKAEPQRATTSAMPDPKLAADMTEQLLQPAAQAAVRDTFARLGTVALGAQGLTLEAMVRDMLRPMLKEWLDENLPSMVERMVEKEIERISRGGS